MSYHQTPTHEPVSSLRYKLVCVYSKNSNPSEHSYAKAHLFVLQIVFRLHFQCIVRVYDLIRVENANQHVSMQGKNIRIIHKREGRIDKSIPRITLLHQEAC